MRYRHLDGVGEAAGHVVAVELRATAAEGQAGNNVQYVSVRLGVRHVNGFDGRLVLFHGRAFRVAGHEAIGHFVIDDYGVFLARYKIAKVDVGLVVSVDRRAHH